MSGSSSGSGAADADEIRNRAFQLWNQDGCPEGRALDYWLRAEAELAAGGAAHDPAGTASPATPQAADEPAPPRAPRRAAKAKAGAAKPDPSPDPPEVAPSGEEQSERRDALVQQRRNRDQAEG
jgi:hypothetical protein